MCVDSYYVPFKMFRSGKWFATKRTILIPEIIVNCILVSSKVFSSCKRLVARIAGMIFQFFMYSIEMSFEMPWRRKFLFAQITEVHVVAAKIFIISLFALDECLQIGQFLERMLLIIIVNYEYFHIICFCICSFI